MTDEQMEDIRETYRAAASAVGLPKEWGVRVETTQWCYDNVEGMGVEGMEHILENEATSMLVDPNGMAHILTEHGGPVKQVHAERYIEKGLAEHRREIK
ncbi:hypothetical protein [Salinibacter ruber]|uniref:hypothetical protein n=1 Tax=Salinibacter ruber TaxID=146919 RepID=UPI0021676CEB|nr:hypothetical protein [Salinibacter ruber]MCS4185320.1 gamma-glutamylcysteine synthetase [Salinibacter ruber]